MTAALAAAVVVLAGALALRAILAAGARGLAPAPRPWRRPPPAVVAASLEDAAVPVAPDVVWAASVAATGVAVLVAGVVAGPGLVLVVVAVAVGTPALTLAAGRGRSGRLVDAALPDVLDGVARSLRSGGTVRAALGESAAGAPGRLGHDLRTVVAAADGGVPIVAALDAWPARCPTPGVRLAATALALAAEAGGAAARAVDGVASTLRANLAVAAEVRAQSSQARLSGLVIGVAPVAFGLLAAGTDGRTAAFLLRTPVGVGCLAAGLALDGAGAWWMHRITAAPA